MPKVVYDTSSFISHRPTSFPAGFLMSAVVIQELTAGAGDKSEVQYWERAWQAHEKAGTLLVPTGANWWFAGKVLNSLLRGLKSHAGGRTPKLAPQEKQRIIRDGQCCKKCFEVRKFFKHILLGSDLKQAFDKLRLAHRIISS